jgi:F-type H+-transporting ATPase subunit b
MGLNKRWIFAGVVGLAVMGATVALASSGGGHEAAAAAGHDKGLPWEDFIYRCINFGILLAAVILILRKPLGTALKGRTEGIKEELAELEAKREEARREYAMIEKRLADAVGERDAILAEFRQQGEREYDKILSNAKLLAERIKSQAQFTIEQETAQAKAELRKEVAELSAGVAEDLLKQNINSEDQARLVGEYLAKVQQEVQ